MITSQKYMQPTFAPAKPRTGLHKLGDLVNNFLVEYWAHIIMIILGSLVFIALAIPFLSYFGLDSIAKPLFFALHYVCAQIPITFVLSLWAPVWLMRTQPLHLRINVPGQPDFCADQKAHTGYSLVGMGLDAITNRCGRSYPDGRMAREHLGTTRDYWLRSLG